jgi:hypothetical protein
MTDSLVVDPARLKAAGTTIRDQVMPTAPPPMSAPGSDPVSAAINVTMPIIESPVIEGLPDVQAALTNTGSKIITAADRYAETDQLLGENVGAVQFLASGAPAAKDEAAAQAPPPAATRQLGAETADKDKDKDKDKKVKPGFDPATMASGLGQMTGMLGQFGGMGSGLMSSAQGAMGGMGAGSSGAKLADDTTKAPDAPADQAQLVNDTKAGDGAARGDQASEAAPTQAGSSADSRSRPV